MTRDQFLPYVMPELPGCPIPLIMSKALEVLMDLCTRGSPWVEPLDPLSLTAGVSTYELDPPAGARIISIKSASIGGRPVTPRTRSELTESLGSLWSSHTGQPIHYTLSSLGELTVYPVPSSGGMVLNIDAQLMPIAPLNSIPDAVANLDLMAIINGVKARLMIMKGQPWSAPDLAAVYMSEYERLVSQASVRQHFGGGSRSLIVPPQPFGGVHMKP